MRISSAARWRIFYSARILCEVRPFGPTETRGFIAQRQRVYSSAVINELIFLVEDDPSGGYSAKALGVGIFTQGDTRDELSANVREAVEVYFDKPDEMPRLIRLHYVHDEVFAL